MKVSRGIRAKSVGQSLTNQFFFSAMRTLASETLKACLNFLSKLSTECLPRSAVSHSFGKVLTFSKCLETRLRVVGLYCRVECVSLRLANYEMKVILEPGCREGRQCPRTGMGFLTLTILTSLKARRNTKSAIVMSPEPLEEIEGGSHASYEYQG